MDYGVEQANGEDIYRLSGRLTFNDHARVRGLIREMQAAKSRRQVLHLTGLEFIDSAGIGMLLIAREELKGVDKDFVLRGATGQVKRVFTVAQLGKLITIED